MVERESPGAEFAWGAFFLRWFGAVLALTAAAVAAYLLVHEYLYEWSEVERSTRESPKIWAALLQRAQETVRLLLDLLHPSWFTWTLALGAPLLALLGSGWRIARAERLGGRGIAEALNATPVTGTESEPVRRVLFECVAARARARAIAAPPLYLFDELESVCAASFGSGPADAVLVVSRGAAQRLDPVTLEALIDWQLAALEGGRLHRDLRIAGFLHPFLWLWLMGDALRRLELKMDELNDRTTPKLVMSPLWKFTIRVAIGAMVARLLLRIAGFPGLALGRLLQREALAADVRLRDRAVAAMIPDPDALAAALLQSVPREAAAQDLGDELFAAEAETVEYAHAFFAEPAPVPNEPRLLALARRLASHGDPLLRLRRFAPRFDAAAYEQRAARIAAEKNALGFAHGAPDASMLQAGAPAHTPAPAARPALGDPAEEMERAEFFLRFERPVLELYRTPQGASRLLRAAVAPAAAGQDALRPVLERLGARERRWVIERGMEVLRDAPETVRAAHLRAHRLLIEMDRRLTLEELTDWLYVERGLGLVRPAASASPATPSDAALLRSLLAGSGAKDVAAIESAVQRVRAASVSARVQLVRDCLAAARADGKLSEDESELLRRLCFIFDLSPALLADGAAKAAARPAAPAEFVYPPPEGAVLQARPGAGELPVARPCGRCEKRAGLYRASRSAGDVLADWTVPVLLCLGVGLVIFWTSAPHRSLQPDAWRNAIGLWVLGSVAVIFVMSISGLFLEGVVFPRWVAAGTMLLLLAGGTVLFYAADRGLGVIAGNAVFWLSMLAYELTRKMPVPGGTFYFCRGCGLTTPVEANAAD